MLKPASLASCSNTKARLRNIIQAWTDAGQGRMSLTELARTLPLDDAGLEVAVDALAGVERIGRDVLSAQFIAANQWALCERLNAIGYDSLSNIGKHLAISIDLLSIIVSSSFLDNASIAHDSERGDMLICIAFLPVIEQRILQALQDVQQPLLLSDFFQSSNLPPGIAREITERLVREGQLQGTCTGTLFTPSLYTKSLHDWVRTCLAQDGYIIYAALRKRGILDNHKAWLSADTHITNAIFGDELAYTDIFIEELNAEVMDLTSKSNFMWMDFRDILHEWLPAYSDGDATTLLKSLPILRESTSSKDHLILLADHYLIRNDIYNHCFQQLDTLIDEMCDEYSKILKRKVKGKGIPRLTQHVQHKELQKYIASIVGECEPVIDNIVQMLLPQVNQTCFDKVNAIFVTPIIEPKTNNTLLEKNTLLNSLTIFRDHVQALEAISTHRSLRSSLSRYLLSHQAPHITSQLRQVIASTAVTQSPEELNKSLQVLEEISKDKNAMIFADAVTVMLSHLHTDIHPTNDSTVLTTLHKAYEVTAKRLVLDQQWSLVITALLGVVFLRLHGHVLLFSHRHYEKVLAIIISDTILSETFTVTHQMIVNETSPTTITTAMHHLETMVFALPRRDHT